MQANEIADSFGVRQFPVRRVPLDAPWSWLSRGWRDMWTVPHISLLYGAFFVAMASVILLGLTQFGAQSLMLVLSAGFLLLGPLMAVGLYEASRRLEAREPVTFRDVLFVKTASPGQLMLVGLFLGMSFLFWVEVALFIFAISFGPQPFPPLDEFVPTLLLTWFGLGMLIVGTLSGGVLAAIVFSATVASIPLLMSRQVNAVTAIAASLQVVAENGKTLALWAGLIAVLMALGFLAGLVGLVVIFPLLGHASWHAFRDLMADAPAQPTPEQARAALA